MIKSRHFKQAKYWYSDLHMQSAVCMKKERSFSIWLTHTHNLGFQQTYANVWKLKWKLHRAMQFLIKWWWMNNRSKQKETLLPYRLFHCLGYIRPPAPTQRHRRLHTHSNVRYTLARLSTLQAKLRERRGHGHYGNSRAQGETIPVHLAEVVLTQQEDDYTPAKSYKVPQTLPYL